MCGLFMQLNAQEIKLVKNINASGSAAIMYQTVFNGKLYFSATDGTNGQELWVSDGTDTGTYLFKDINPSGSSNPMELKVCNGKLYFQASTDGGATPGLWVSDGTQAGTINITNNFHSPQEFTEMNGKIYFSAVNNQYGTEFWVTDGTLSGTHIVKNILSLSGDGGFSSEPACFTVYDNKIYFVAKSNATSFQIYESDGTEAGTVVFNKFPNMGQSTMMKFMVCNGKMFFNPLENADDAGTFLYVYDGTNVEKFAINGTDFSNPSCFFNWNNQLAFIATTNANGNELWISDGTLAGTKILKDICSGAESSNPTEFCVMNNNLYFSAADTLSNMELWVSDGTTAGTLKVKEINTNSLNTRQSSPSDLTLFNNKLYFSARPILNQTFLFCSDGTAANTKQIDTALTAGYPPNFNPQVSNLIALDSILFFTAKYTNANILLYKLYFPLLEAPVALPATDINDIDCSFIAHWNSVPNANHYLLYVSLNSDFSSCISNYDGLSVSDTFKLVTVGGNCTPYYYRVLAVNNYDTSNYSNSISVMVGGAVNETSLSSLKIYPNPVSSQLMISMENECMDACEIIDINGKTIARQTLDNNQATIDVSYLPAGIYILNIVVGERSINQKFIKE